MNITIFHKVVNSMKELADVIGRTSNLGIFTETELRLAYEYVFVRYAVDCAEPDEDTRWVIFRSIRDGSIAGMLHVKYKIGFFLPQLRFADADFYVEYVETFDIPEWCISDTDRFNRLFPELSWTVSERVADPHKFSLMDLRFVTE